MFWFRAKKGDGQKPAHPRPDVSAPLTPLASNDLALDATAGLLRILGKYAFDLDQLNAAAINDLCEQWARHVLIATPYPGADDVPSTERNWQGLRDFITQLRRQEKVYVTTHFKEMRHVLGDFIDTLGKVIVENQEDQTQIADQLNQLKTVVESNAPLEAIKREAMQVIGAISHIAEERHRIQHDVLEQLAGKINTMRAELSAARREMELDPLTRLYNRKAFDQQLLRTFEFNKLSSQPACLLMVDLDHFKQINDKFGHLVGDLVLRKFADCCAQSFPRRSDFVARYGGEEFAIIVQEASAEVATMLGERLLQAVQQIRIPHEGQEEIHITVSIGIAELNAHSDLTGWLRQADSALYRAKQGGRNRLAL